MYWDIYVCTLMFRSYESLSGPVSYLNLQDRMSCGLQKLLGMSVLMHILFRYCIPKFVYNKITFCFGEITYLEILLQSLVVAALVKCDKQ